MAKKDLNKTVAVKKSSKKEGLEGKILTKIKKDQLAPESNWRLKLRGAAPVLLAVGFGLLAMLGVYAILSRVFFYRDYGPGVEIMGGFGVVLLILFILSFGLVGSSVYLLHKSDVGYKYRWAGLILVVFGLVLIGGMALRHERFERALDTVGIGERLRPEDGRRGRMGMMGPDLSSHKEGVVGSADDKSVVIKLSSGKEVSFSRSDQVQIMPRHIKLSSGIRVEVGFDDDGTVKLVRILPRD